MGSGMSFRCRKPVPAAAVLSTFKGGGATSSMTIMPSSQMEWISSSLDNTMFRSEEIKNPRLTAIAFENSASNDASMFEGPPLTGFSSKAVVSTEYYLPNTSHMTGWTLC